MKATVMNIIATVEDNAGVGCGGDREAITYNSNVTTVKKVG